MPTTEKQRFLLLVRSPSDQPDPSPAEMEKIFGLWAEWMKGMKAKGQYLGGDKLADGGKVVRAKRGAAVTDGPYAESKEEVGGYFVVVADSLAQATDYAKGCPGLDFGTTVEVRPIEEMPPI